MACLYIVRHADAQKDNYEDDFNRELTEEGIQEAVHSKTKLHEKLDPNGIVLVSSAKRTQQTADFLTFPPGWKRLNLTELYECHLADAIVLLTDKLKNYTGQVALVGHNAFVSNFCSYLSGDFTNLKTADICLLKIKETDFATALQLKGNWDKKIL